MKEQIEKLFPHSVANQCCQIRNEKAFGVSDYDDESPCVLILDNIEDADFTIINENESDILLVFIDKCLFTEKDGKRCDFGLIHDKTICFVEIKSATLKQRNLAKKDAYKQLENTINYFQDNLNLEGFHLEAIVCMSRVKKAYPVQSASSGAKEIYFLEKLRAVLLEGNLKKFE